MSSMRLLILGVLHKKEMSHGYEVRQELESWNAERWANIAYGSIYFALNKMAQEGLVEALESEARKSSARVQYRITEQGKKEFMRLLRNQWWEIKPLIDPFQVALTFMNYMPREELILALESRIEQKRIFMKSFERMVPLRMSEHKIPRHIQENFNLTLAYLKAEIEWLESALTKIKEGTLP